MSTDPAILRAMYDQLSALRGHILQRHVEDTNRWRDLLKCCDQIEKQLAELRRAEHGTD